MMSHRTCAELRDLSFPLEALNRSLSRLLGHM